MKKTLATLLLLAGLSPVMAQTGETGESGFAAAQPQQIAPVRLGFLARPSLTWLTADNRELDSKGVKPGFSFGLIIDMMLGRNANYAFSTGLLYNMADGGKLKYKDVRYRSANGILDQAVTDVNINLQYLEVPLTLKLKTNQIGYMTYFGQLGLQAGVNISAKQTGEYQYVEAPTNTVLIEKENINDATRLFNAGLLVGIGAEYNISGSTNILFGISYYRGFTNVLKGNVYNTNDRGVILEDNDGPDGNTITVGQLGSKRSAVLSNIALNVGVIF